MTDSASGVQSLGRPAFVPLRLADGAMLHKILAVLAGSWFLAAASQLSVPMYPVPMTMQTFAVLLVGALYGWRLGAITVLTFLGQAFAGMPFLANGAGGPLPFMGPTAGYLAGFVVAAAAAGWLAERGWTSNGVLRLAVVAVTAHVIILAFGVAWLAAMIGTAGAIAHGLTPFLAGTVLKSALGVATILGIAGVRDFIRNRR
jgi:biotin transport system substrate-specific component